MSGHDPIERVHGKLSRATESAASMIGRWKSESHVYLTVEMHVHNKRPPPHAPPLPSTQ